MFYGTITLELQIVLDEYERRFGYDANGEISVEYSHVTIEQYIIDLRESIKTGTHIAALYPIDESDEEDW